MGGRMSRAKGANAEREIVNIAKSYGLEARRWAPMQTQFDSTESDVIIEGKYFVESKRQEKISMPAWIRQAESCNPPGSEPVVAFRTNRQPWRVTLRMDRFLELLALEKQLNERKSNG